MDGHLLEIDVAPIINFALKIQFRFNQRRIAENSTRVCSFFMGSSF